MNISSMKSWSRLKNPAVSSITKQINQNIAATKQQKSTSRLEVSQKLDRSDI